MSHGIILISVNLTNNNQYQNLAGGAWSVGEVDVSFLIQEKTENKYPHEKIKCHSQNLEKDIVGLQRFFPRGIVNLNL